MAEYNTSFAVGGAQTFGQAWAPCNGDIGTVTSNWLYGGGCAYPAPYRSFQQNLINGNNYLGPYCRRLDGVAGRLKVSISAQIGEIGFVQQCWYDYPRGANDKVDGVVADTNQVWWDTKVSRKYWVQVYNLNDDNAPLIWVQVAISAGTAAYPLLSMHDVSNGPLQGDCIRYIRSGHNLYGGQTNPLQLYTGIPGNCGIKTSILSTLAIPTATGQGGWIPDVSFLENGAFAGAGWCLAGDGEAATEAGVIYNALNTSQKNDAGDYFSDANRANNFASALAAHLAEVKDLLDKLSTFHYGAAAGNYAGMLAYNHSNEVFTYSQAGNAKFKVDSSGQVLPGADNAQNLGSSTLRWKNIYSADLHCSNKGSKNDVDGTWGDYTIQEGESDLFLINNRSGKKYKFNLTEVN